MVGNVGGWVLRDGVRVRGRWAECFELVLNVADVKEAGVYEVGGWRVRCWEI